MTLGGVAAESPEIDKAMEPIEIIFVIYWFIAAAGVIDQTSLTAIPSPRGHISCKVQFFIIDVTTCLLIVSNYFFRYFVVMLKYNPHI